MIRRGGALSWHRRIGSIPVLLEDPGARCSGIPSGICQWCHPIGPQVWERSRDFRRWSADGHLWLAAGVHRSRAGKSVMAPSMDKVDAMRQHDGQLLCKDSWLYRYIATAFLLGRMLRAFLCELPALFHNYLASVLSGPGASSFHAKYGEDCNRLLSSRCCVSDYERSAFGLLDPKGLYDYPGTQNGHGNRIYHGRDRNGCLRGKAAHIFTLAHDRCCRMRNSGLRHLRILPDARWSRSGRTMDWPAKWLRELSRCCGTRTDGIRTGSHRQFCRSNGNHCGRVGRRGTGLGVRSRPSRASELGNKGRSFDNWVDWACIIVDFA